MGPTTHSLTKRRRSGKQKIVKSLAAKKSRVDDDDDGRRGEETRNFSGEEDSFIVPRRSVEEMFGRKQRRSIQV